jgi:cyanophycinase
MTNNTKYGCIALIGGNEWAKDCEFDLKLLEYAGTDTVNIFPTAAAFENPELTLKHARQYFESLGAKINEIRVLSHQDAMDPKIAEEVSYSKFNYLGGGSPLHLRSVLKNSVVYEALIESLSNGGVIAGSSAGAMVLGDPMVDPRGGAYTIGLGLVPGICPLVHFKDESDPRIARTLSFAPKDVYLAGIPECGCLVRLPDGNWQYLGKAEPKIFYNHKPVDISSLKSLKTVGL